MLKMIAEEEQVNRAQAESDGARSLWAALSPAFIWLVGPAIVAGIVALILSLHNDILPAAATGLLSQIYLRKASIGSGALPLTSRIILFNSAAVVLTATFGIAGAWFEATARSRFPWYDRIEAPASRPIARIAALFWPQLRTIPDSIARQSVVVALIFPFVALGANGVAIGLLLGVAGPSGGIGVTINDLLPHGIPELAALILAAALGIRHGRQVMQAASTGVEALCRAAREQLRAKELWGWLALALILIAAAGLMEPVG